MDILEKRKKRYRRHKRTRARIKGTARMPRLCVFRSSKHIYAQLINDDKGNILIAVSDLELKNKEKAKERKSKEGEKPLAGKTAKAYKIGKLIAEKALERKIEKIVFDRAGYQYHGRVKALAEGARDGGLKF